MIYYFLPGSARAGGVKVACQFISMLIKLGARAVMVLPEGIAPQWFASNVPVVSEEQASANIGPQDWIMITWPPDHQRLQQWPGRMVNHCQGTDPLMDPIFADTRIPILTCWAQAAEYVRGKFGRPTIDVGISISPCFYYDGTIKSERRVAYMPRRGAEIAETCIESCQGLDFRYIDGLDETEVASRLKQAGVYLATSVGEQFGLPALEAMAAGCVVISVPVKGGTEYLRDGENCLMVTADSMAERLRWVMAPERAQLRWRLRRNAVATAVEYRMSKQLRKLAALRDAELAWLWT